MRRKGGARQPYAAVKGCMPVSHTLRQEGCMPGSHTLRQKGVYSRQPCTAAKAYMPGSHTLRRRRVCPADMRCGKKAAAIRCGEKAAAIRCGEKGVCPAAIRCGRGILSSPSVAPLLILFEIVTTYLYGSRVPAIRSGDRSVCMHGSHTLRQEGGSHTLRQRGGAQQPCAAAKGCTRQPYAAATGYMPGSHTLRQRGVCRSAIRCCE